MTTPAATSVATRAVARDSARGERPLRVAHLTATFPPYLAGAGNVCFQLAEGLAARGHEIEVLTAPAAGVPPVSHAKVRRVQPVAAIGNAPMITDVARLAGFDLVHLHYPFIFGTEMLLAGAWGRAGGKIVVTYHNRLIGEGLRKPLFRLYEETWGRALARRANRICVVSEAHASTVPYLRGVRHRSPERICVLPNGVDVTRFSPGPDTTGVRAELGIADDAVVAAYVATLDRAHYFKRLDVAIDALARASDPRLHLLVVGAGEWETRFREQAAQAGVADRVRWAGKVGHDRLPDLLRASDLLLLTSELESFGMVLLEAMACGLPTVATDLPGVRVVVDAPRSGLLAPRGDSEAFAAAIDRLAGMDAEERAAMGRAGRNRCEETYGWPSIVERLERVYRETLSSN